MTVSRDIPLTTGIFSDETLSTITLVVVGQVRQCLYTRTGVECNNTVMYLWYRSRPALTLRLGKTWSFMETLPMAFVFPQLIDPASKEDKIQTMEVAK